MFDRQLISIIPFSSPTGRTVTSGSNSPYLRKRRPNQQAKKTNEEVIMEAHQQLLSYVDNIDDQVNKVVKGYEAEFLEAYRRHFLKVREQMKQIGNRTQTALEDNRLYVQKIEGLEKEVVLFREQSLKLSEKNNELQQQLRLLKFKIKQLEDENQRINKEVSKLMRQKREADVNFQRMNQQQQESQSPAHNTFKHTQPISPFTEQRTPSMSLRSYSRRINLGLQSLKSSTQKSHNKRGEKFKEENISKQLNKTIEFTQKTQEKPEGFRERRSTIDRFTRPRVSTQKLSRDQIKRIKSQQLTNRNQYQKIFMDCVEEVRKDVLRRNKMTGLHFYKNKGPMDFAQFKRIDYHLLLYMFLNNNKVLHNIHNMLFREEIIQY